MKNGNPSSKRYRDSNPRPLKHDLSPITTRPGHKFDTSWSVILPPMASVLWLNSLNLKRNWILNFIIGTQLLTLLLKQNFSNETAQATITVTFYGNDGSMLFISYFYLYYYVWLSLCRHRKSYVNFTTSNQTSNAKKCIFVFKIGFISFPLNSSFALLNSAKRYYLKL